MGERPLPSHQDKRRRCNEARQRRDRGAGRRNLRERGAEDHPFFRLIEFARPLLFRGHPGYKPRMHNLTIRNATPGDIDACLTLESACFSPAEAACRENIAIRINEFPQGFLVAEAEGRIIGQVNSGATTKDDITDEAFKGLIGHDPQGRNIVVFSLAVLPEMQGRGLGATLMRRFTAESRQLGHQQILLLCKEGLVPFYSRLGFADRGLSASTHGGAIWHEMGLIL